jgi:hopene-associated glycosyltransferase HpnB
MRVMPHVFAALPLIIWLYLLLARGAFWRIALPAAPALPPSAYTNKIIAVIPARDEVAVIGDTVGSILQQAYGGEIHVIVVDDGSTDGTANAAVATAARLGASTRLTVITGAPLRTGWTGKLWAMSQGVAAAAALEPDYLLFTDADIHHDPGNIVSLVANAEAHDRDLVSYMVELPTASLAEKCLIPAFVFFFLQLYPPKWIASSDSTTAGAAGGCMLMRPRALARMGGLEAIRSQLIDDCALARATKAGGGSVWLGLTHSAHSARGYESFAQIGRMISRSAFHQLRHSYLLLAATTLGLCVTYALPPLLLLSGDPLAITLGALSWALMSAAYVPIIRFYRLSPLWSLSLPVVALFYAVVTIHSALQYQRRRGGIWKGRIQDQRN